MTIYLPDGTIAQGTPWECVEALRLYGRGPREFVSTSTNGGTNGPDGRIAFQSAPVWEINDKDET